MPSQMCPVICFRCFLREYMRSISINIKLTKNDKINIPYSPIDTFTRLMLRTYLIERCKTIQELIHSKA